MTTIEQHADAILRAAGSSLSNYVPSGQGRAAIIAATEAAYEAGRKAGWTAFEELMMVQLGPYMPDVRKGAWQPIETAPRGVRVEVRAGSMTFLAELWPGASIDEDGGDSDQWVAALEGEHPPCWSEGACWASNENEDISLQPTAWRHLAAPKIQHSEGE